LELGACDFDLIILQNDKIKNNFIIFRF